MEHNRYDPFDRIGFDECFECRTRWIVNTFRRIINCRDASTARISRPIESYSTHLRLQWRIVVVSI